MTHWKYLVVLLFSLSFVSNVQAQDDEEEDSAMMVHRHRRQQVDSAFHALLQRTQRVSIAEIKQRYATYKQTKDTTIIPRDKIKAWWLVNPISPTLPEFRGRNVRVHWEDFGEQGECWVYRITHADTGQPDTATWNACVAKWGCDTFYCRYYGESPVIKITPPEGIYVGAMARFPYMGFVGCKAYGVVGVDKEGRALYRKEVPYMSEYVKHSVGLPQWSNMAHDFWRDWEAPESVQCAYTLLSHELSLKLRKYKEKEEFWRMCFLEVQPNGKLCLHALEDNYTSEEQRAFRKLRKAVSSLTKNAIMGIYLDDGRYLPGHFVQVQTSIVANTWILEMPEEVHTPFYKEWYQRTYPRRVE